MPFAATRHLFWALNAPKMRLRLWLCPGPRWGAAAVFGGLLCSRERWEGNGWKEKEHHPLLAHPLHKAISYRNPWIGLKLRTGTETNLLFHPIASCPIVIFTQYSLTVDLPVATVMST